MGATFSTSGATSETSGGTTETSGEVTTEATEETDATDPSAGGRLCGDGTVDPGEACDDGNISSADACLADCTLATCGDGIVWLGTEECDLGAANDGKSPSGCRLDCRAPACGDGALYPATFGAAVELATSGNHSDAKLSESSPRAVAIDGSGKVLVVTDWVSSGGLKHLAVVERYTPEGELFGPPIVAVDTNSGVSWPGIAASPGGAFIVVWAAGGDSHDVYFRRFDADGAALTEPTIVSENKSGSQRNPMVAMNSAGEALVTFRATSGPDPVNRNVVRARKLPARGLGAPDFVVSDIDSDVSAPTAAIRSDGSFVVGYAERNVGTIYVASYDSAGAATLLLDGVEGLVSAADGSFHWVGVAAPENGDIAIAGMTESSNLGVHRYDSSGALLHEVIASEPLGSIPRIDLRADPEGNLIAFWGGCGLPGESDNCKGDPSLLGLRRIYADGEPFEKPVQVAALTSWQRQGIGVAINERGDMAVVAEELGTPYLLIARPDCP